MSWSEKCRESKEMQGWFKANKAEYLLDLGEILENNGFKIIGAMPGISFFRKSAVKMVDGYRAYPEHASYSLNQKQTKIFLELLQKVKQ